MRPVPFALAVGLGAVLVQACGGDASGPGLDPRPGGTASNADCMATPVYVEGSSAIYRFERADGTTEEVAATVSAYSDEDESVTFTLEGDGGAYSVTDNLGCYDTGNAPARPANDVENDPIARALLTPYDPRFDEALSTSTPPTPVSPTESVPCETLSGSEESEPFAEREVRRCTRAGRTTPDGEATTVTTELALSYDAATAQGLAVPLVGVVFRERASASGEVDRVRLIDWNDGQ